MQPSIRIKDVSVLREVLFGFAPMLVDILVWIVQEYKQIVITSAFRKGDKGVHGSGRGIDLRSWIYKSPSAEEICDAINKRWIYDPNRPEMVCAMIHKVKGGGIHFHIQVHPNTRLR